MQCIPSLRKKTSLQLKRAWGYLRNKVKVEYASYTKKKFATGGGPPPSPPKLSPLLEATANLISEELELAEFQYDSSCRDVPLPTNPLPEAPKSPSPQPPKSPSPQPLHPSSPLLVLHEEDYEWIEDGPPPLEAVPLPPPSTMGSCSAEPAIPGPSKKADCGQQKTIPNTSANRKRKRVQERDNVFNSIREENSNLKKRSLQIMEEKHVKELEVLECSKYVQHC
ncbi:cyclic AMP-dependent transcription factor ATF-5-like [Portunus trituberculatus]|uniref:cyclic AMP-dependent transcription factor ATF-5-like n=1 Tax=Portunus trituberculatus TaxID=210409 RepID=UPI001E1CCB1D|nr:cyclic AMP-dependent transcription factor ATF-5-like [Portunus trituberculatus]